MLDFMNFNAFNLNGCPQMALVGIFKKPLGVLKLKATELKFSTDKGHCLRLLRFTIYKTEYCFAREKEIIFAKQKQSIPKSINDCVEMIMLLCLISFFYL